MLDRAARLGRGLLAHAGAGGAAPDRAARLGRGLIAHAGAGGWVLDRAARPGRAPGQGGRLGAARGSAPWSWPLGARWGGRLGAGQGSAPWS